MQDSTRALYAKHPEGAETGDMARAQRFAKTVLYQDWVPTVVNPTNDPGPMDRAKFYFHLVVWVVALALGATMNFMSKSAMEDKSAVTTESCYDAVAADNTCYTGISDTTYTIAILSAVATILGVVFLLGGAAWFTAEEYRKTAWLNTLITFLTVYGMVGSLYIFMHAAAQPTQGFFWLSLFAVIFLSYAQILLYCTSAKLNVLMLPRAFLPSIGASVQFVSALAISSGDFKNTAGAEFTDSQKLVAWLAPGFTFGALVVMIVLRRTTRVVEAGKGVKDIGDFPFLRSIVLSLFFTAAVLSVYKLSFMTVDNNDSSAYIFALAGALFNFVILSVVFVPGGDAYGLESDPAAAGEDRFIG